MVDGCFGEVLTTCEKINWTLAHGEAALRPETRPVGVITLHKRATVCQCEGVIDREREREAEREIVCVCVRV